MVDPALAEAARITPIYRLAWLTARTMGAFYFGWRVLHSERVPRIGSVILASNHVSFGDPALVGGTLPRAINYIGRENLFAIPVFGWLIRQLKAVPVNRDGGGGAGLKAILDRLIAGGGIILFPEGTRTPDGSLLPAKPGIGLTIIKSDAPVVPVRIFGLFEAWGRHRRFPRPGRITIKFGQPMDFSTLRTEAKTCSKARLKGIYQQAADEIMAAIARLEPCEDVCKFG